MEVTMSSEGFTTEFMGIANSTVHRMRSVGYLSRKSTVMKTLLLENQHRNADSVTQSTLTLKVVSDILVFLMPCGVLTIFIRSVCCVTTAPNETSCTKNVNQTKILMSDTWLVGSVNGKQNTWQTVVC